MAIMMVMNWDGIKPEQYETLRGTVDWENNVPKGLLFHVSAFKDKDMHVCDVWDSEDDFNSFVHSRLMPEVQKLGIKNAPKVQVYPVHKDFAPGYKK